MLKVTGLRWHLEDDNMCCGRALESGLVEICFRDMNGDLVFVSASEYDCCEQIMIADHELFELLKGSEWEHAKNAASMILEFEKGDREDIAEGISGDYSNAIKLARLALKTLLEIEETDADTFIAEYLNIDVDTLELPLVCLEGEWDEEEENEQETMECTEKMIVLETASKKGYRSTPYPICECAILDAERVWNALTEKERSVFELFRVSEGVYIMTGGGPLFVADKIIRDYLK